MTLGTKVLSLISIVLLITLASGVLTMDFALAKFVVFISSCYLAVVAWRTKEKMWLVFFVAVALIFLPVIKLFSFSYAVWRTADAIVAAGFAFFIYRYYDGYRKGSAFEKFVASRLLPEEWAIEDWTKDKSRGLKRHVESDMNPDLTVRNVSTGKRFAVECKFRSRFWKDNEGITGIFWKAYNHDFYRNYGDKENIKVKIVFGVGGNPKNPSRLFVVPIESLEEYKGKNIPAQYLQKFEKDIKIPLTLDNPQTKV
ncbi:MAG: DUF6804 family protein [Candidatus Paceibacterota bacterium]|jgi:hypothetical protein